MLEKMLIIDGALRQTDSKLEVRNPVDNQVFAIAQNAGVEEVNQAVAAAKRAFPAWSRTTPFYRGALLREAGNLVLENKDEIARLMTMEQGKPLPEATAEVEKGAEILRYYAEEGERVYGRIIASPEGLDVVSQVIYQPIGPVACISPWNYPIELMAWKVACAMASGCTCVLKVPSETPLSPILFVETMLKAGFPNGVLNVISGPGRQIGDALTTHPDIKKIAFTGSTPVGRSIMKSGADTLKHMSLELGGSLPMVVCDDCDLDAAVKGAVRRSFRNMGQICIAINRIYVAREIYEEFLSRFAAKTRELKIGNGLLDACDLGPMCTPKGVETTKRHIADAIGKNARLVCGGKVPEGKEAGNFYEPSILRDVDHSMLVMTEETFGPLVGVMPFDTLDQAIDMANDTEYGLGAIVFTQSLTTANRMAQELNAGNVAINNVDAGAINAPYGGWYNSGFGHEHGPEGLYQYLHVKHLRMKMI